MKKLKERLIRYALIVMIGLSFFFLGKFGRNRAIKVYRI